MANWGTLKQRLKEETLKEGSLSGDHRARALEAAIKYYRNHRFWFNESDFSFVTVDQTAAYGQEGADGRGDGYPSDLLKIIVATIKVNNFNYPLKPIAVKEYREIFLNTTYTGYPENFMYQGDQIYLEPTPNGVYTVSCDYVQDLGTPTASYSGSTWSTTVGGVAIRDTYTNAWFTDAQELVMCRAKWWLYSKHYKNVESAQIAKLSELEEYRQLTLDSNKVITPRDAVAWV